MCVDGSASEPPNKDFEVNYCYFFIVRQNATFPYFSILFVTIMSIILLSHPKANKSVHSYQRTPIIFHVIMNKD